MKVVESGYKIDLHIHSVCSRSKDKSLLLHKLTEYRKQQDGPLNKSVVRGYRGGKLYSG